MKLSGGILVLVSAIFTGITVSFRLKKRYRFLGEIILFISRLSMEIEFISLPLLDILKKIEADDCCRSLDFISVCHKNMLNGDDFFSSWRQAVDASELPMKSEEKEKLKNLGSMLGTSDISGQRAMLLLYKSYFTAFYDKALQEHDKYAKMCVTLGVVAGTGIFILII